MVPLVGIYRQVWPNSCRTELINEVSHPSQDIATCIEAVNTGIVDETRVPWENRQSSESQKISRIKICPEQDVLWSKSVLSRQLGNQGPCSYRGAIEFDTLSVYLRQFGDLFKHPLVTSSSTIQTKVKLMQHFLVKNHRNSHHLVQDPSLADPCVKVYQVFMLNVTSSDFLLAILVDPSAQKFVSLLAEVTDFLGALQFPPLLKKWLPGYRYNLDLVHSCVMKTCNNHKQFVINILFQHFK